MHTPMTPVKVFSVSRPPRLWANKLLLVIGVCFFNISCDVSGFESLVDEGAWRAAMHPHAVALIRQLEAVQLELTYRRALNQLLDS